MLSTLLTMLENEDDRQWFFSLFQYYYTYMYQIAWTILKDTGLAEDAVQDSFEAVIRYADRNLEIGSRKLENTLRIIQRNKAFDIYNKRQKIHGTESPEIFDALENLPAPKEDLGALGEALIQLKTEYQEILMLRYDSGYSTKEIAGLLAISHENAKKRLSRAKAALAMILKSEGII